MELGVDLKQSETWENKWKKMVIQKIKNKMEDASKNKVRFTERYSEIIRDKIEMDVPKRYMLLPKSVASIVFRARARVFNCNPTPDASPLSVYF